MLRLLHTADVHLGARHTDLGERAAMLRERQFAAFRATIDLALAESVDLVLIAGDLFDSNTQPRRSVERVAAELARLFRASIRVVIIPGTHDVYDGASIYRSYDLVDMAKASSDMLVVLTHARPEVVFEPLQAVVYGRIFDTKRAGRSPLAGFKVREDMGGTWKIGMVHGSLVIPGRTDADAVTFTEEEIAQTGLDYLALGHWHSAVEGRAGNVTYAYPGSPEPLAADQEGAGQVLLVTLDERGGHHVVTVEGKRVGQTRFQKLDLDISAIKSQPDLIDQLSRHADDNVILDVQLTGLQPDQLDLDLDEVERAVAPSFLHFRIRDLAIPTLPEGPEAPPDTVLGAFMRIVQAKIDDIEAGGELGTGFDLEAAASGREAGGKPARLLSKVSTGRGAPAAEMDQAHADEVADLREVLRLGRHLLEGRQVTL
jgi:exonuclease SbcD